MFFSYDADMDDDFTKAILITMAVSIAVATVVIIALCFL